MKTIALLPADTYFIINKSIITDYDKRIIINLYQPIIGPIAVSLYLTLLSDLDKSEQISVQYTHHHLITSLKNGIEVLRQAREALEAVGLIKTLVQELDNLNNYVYELYNPLKPNDFFNHPVLNIVLYNNIGENEYNNLIEYYKTKKIDLHDYIDISKTINTTYKSINNINNKNISFREEKIIGPSLEDIDYDLIISSIPKNIISDKAFNKRIKELINNLSFVYNIESLKMIDFIRMSIDNNGMINKDTLTNSIRKYYDFNNNGSLPTLIYRTQPDHLREPIGDISNRGKMLYVFDNTSPYDFLMGKNKGIKPTNRDLKLLEYLAVELKMKPSVINVLIDYVLRINDNKLNKAYVETIAGQWIRSGINTASLAMERAEKEHKKNKNKIFTKKDNSNIPVWFNENNESVEVSDKEKETLENMLKEFR